MPSRFPSSSSREPRSIRDIVLIHVPPSFMPLPPLGLGYLAEVLHQMGYEAPLLDLNMAMVEAATPLEKRRWSQAEAAAWRQRDFALDLLRRFHQAVEALLTAVEDRPGYLVGLSVIHPKEAFVRVLVQHLRRRLPDRRVVLGGPALSTHVSRRSLAETCEFDWAVVGEGEHALPALLQALAEGRPPEAVPGVYARRDMLASSLAPAPLIRPLDELPFPRFRGLDPLRYAIREPFPVLWSRGCAWRCHHCDMPRTWGGLRVRSPGHIQQELRYLYDRFYVREVAVQDPVITADPRRLGELARLLLVEGPSMAWRGSFMPSPLLSDELLGRLRESGLRKMTLNLESGSPEVLRRMGRPYSVEEAGATMKRACAAGIEVKLSLMVGFPGETGDDFLQTLYFMHQHREHLVGLASAACCQVPEATDLYLHPERFGIRLVHDRAGADWESLDGRNTQAQREERRQRLLAEAATLGLAAPEEGLVDREHEVD